MSYNREYRASKNSERETPDKLFDLLHYEFNFQLDAAATKENTKCTKYIDVKTNALDEPWNPNGAVWLNPPYSRGIIGQFMEMAWMMSAEYDTDVVCLVPADPSTRWWREHIVNDYNRLSEANISVEIRFLTPRVRFLFQGVPMKGGAMTPNAIVIYNRTYGSGYDRLTRYWNWDLNKYY